MDEAPQEVVPRRRVKRRAAGVFALLLLLVLGLLWALRLPIAADYLRREFERRGVTASYEVKHIAFGRQRVENLVIGDPARPDLTARSVELRLSWGFRRPRVTWITARGVRLRGRVVNGRVSFGQVDKLLPPPTGAPFRFPNQAVDVADASLRLETPAGLVGIGLAGRGNLSDGFRGEMAAMSHDLAVGSCRLSEPRAYWRVAIDDLRPSVAGPLSAARIGCGGFDLVRPDIALAATLSQALNAWEGKAGLAAASATAGGNRLAGLAGNIGFQGDAGGTRGSLDLAAASARLGDVAAGRTRIDGRYSLSLKTGDVSLLADAGARGVSATAPVAGLADALAATGGTPLEQAGEALAAALRRASGAFDLAGSIRLVHSKGAGGLRFDRLIAVSRSGARLTLDGGEGVTYGWPRGLVRIDGNLTLFGGGFPATRLSLRQPRAGGPITGTGRIAPIAAGGSRLALGELRFTAAPGGATSIDTVATLDGPFEDGRVEGLVLPISARIDGRGGFSLGQGCTSARFRTLRTGGLRLGATSLPLCPTGQALVWRAPGGSVRGGASVRSLRLAGTLGNSPISLASSRFLFGLAGPEFTAADLSVVLGRAGAESRFRADGFAGRFDRPGVGGTFTGLEGRLANVPLLLSRGSGRWSVRDGDLLLTGALRVADAAPLPRFHPLDTGDFRLTLEDNLIRAGGWLHDPETDTRILEASIRHSLRTGEGGAVLDVPGIRFDKSYQPEQLTRLTTGVVALVDGVVKGRGEIDWAGGTTTSRGTFSTQDLDFAAAFGPVEGFSTTLRFTDLLGLASAPDQVAQADLIRAGIDVRDGRIRYQLLPGLRVKVESGRWPFAGGELVLEETVLDFSKPTTKRLTFRVTGVDAALLIQQMEFANLSVTGTFDGLIPMVFDQSGGRIEGGWLAAREGGGTLSYIGELTDKELGTYGKLAFDALKSLRYNKLSISLNGALAGEFFAGIELDGIARDPAGTTVRTGGGIRGLVASRALAQLRKVPFEFNITVKGPFRALIATMRSFEDPTMLIQTALPEQLRRQAQSPPVQPEESEIVR